jgi:sugar lactone lactonase YvrE
VFYASDNDNHAIRSIDRTGTVGTIAGVKGMGSGFTDGTGLVAKLNRPNGILALSGADCPWPGDPRAVYLIVADDLNHAVRMLCTPAYGSVPPAGWKPSSDPAQWQVETIAGTGSVGNANGRGDAAAFSSPSAVAALTGRTVYVAEYMGNRVRMLQWTGGSPMDPTHWQVSLVAGDNTSASPVSGNTDGAPTVARFDMPFGLAMDASGSIYVADMGNHRIRRIRPGVTVSTFAGTTAGYLDGAGTTARFQEPRDIASDSAGYLYVTDRGNHRIRRVSPTGAVTTVAGTASGGWTDGRGDVATFDQPNVLAVTASGDLCVADHNVSLGAIVRLVERVFDLGQP